MIYVICPIRDFVLFFATLCFVTHAADFQRGVRFQQTPAIPGIRKLHGPRHAQIPRGSQPRRICQVRYRSVNTRGGESKSEQSPRAVGAARPFSNGRVIPSGEETAQANGCGAAGEVCRGAYGAVRSRDGVRNDEIHVQLFVGRC